jgi:hypothetical protein
MSSGEFSYALAFGPPLVLLLVLIGVLLFGWNRK